MNMNRILKTLPMIFGILMSAVTGAAQPEQTVEVSGRTMGPIPFKVLVVVEETDKETLAGIQKTVSDSLKRVNELMSTYIDDSDISKFNQNQSTEWQSADAETVAVVKRALEISKLTDGAFDPTVAPAVNVWNFGPNKKKPTIPSGETIEKLLAQIGYQNIETRDAPPAIRKSNAETQLDLSAIAKGYAVDRVSKSLTELGFPNHMVEVGGEVVARGHRATKSSDKKGGPWRVAIEQPVASKTAAVGKRVNKVVQLSDQAVATSGNYRNYVTIDGKRYSHTINPKTCRPVLHDLATASIAAPDCMTADAMATAVMVLGESKGHELCESLGFALLTVSGISSDSAMTKVSGDYPAESPEPLTIVPPKPSNSLAVRDSDGEKAGQQKAKANAKGKSSSILPTFIATFVIFALAILGMAVGAMFNNKPVTGSCGGLANMKNEDGNTVCGICSKPTTDCTERNEVETPA
jgi:thiamine biosynthesis lipoprotein